MICIFFSTRVGGVCRRSNSESSLLEHLWSKIHLQPLTKDELEEVGLFCSGRIYNIEIVIGKRVTLGQV